MKAVDIVTIEKLIPIYKDGVKANAIEVARVKNSEGDSIEYDIIVGKGTYKTGDAGIYIQPDYTLPMNKLFLEYHAPFGDIKKSRLGKKGRIRAIKFNLSFKGSEEPIYSYGILISWDKFIEWHADREPTDYEIDNGVCWKVNDIDWEYMGYNDPMFPLQEVLGIEKYVADDSIESGQASGIAEANFPVFLYKTDEETIQNRKKSVDRCFKDKEILSFTLKRDGSSMIEFYRINPIENVEEFGICSRKWLKSLDQMYVSAYKDGDIMLHKYFELERNITGWFNDETQKFYTEEEAAESFEAVMEERRDAWIDTDRKYGYLEKIIAYCKEKGIQLCLRGELIGAGNKGSGNKLNADAKTEARVIWFGVDDISKGFSTRLHYGDEYNLEKVCKDLDFEYTAELFAGVFSYEQIIERAHEYFKMVKENHDIIVEGVVIRTKFSNNLSTKYINPEYDAKS